MKCPNCGKQLVDNAALCDSCGWSASSKEQQKADKRKPPVLVTQLASFAVLVLGLVLLLANKQIWAFVTHRSITSGSQVQTLPETVLQVCGAALVIVMIIEIVRTYMKGGR